MSAERIGPPGARWGFEGWARTSQHRATRSGWSFEKSLSNQERQEWTDLSAERDPEMFFAGMLAFGGRLEEAGKIETAAEVYGAVVEGTPHPPRFAGHLLLQGEKARKSPSPLEGEGGGDGFVANYQHRAQQRLDALQGRGHFGLRAEVLFRNFSDIATDYRTILPMIAGTAVYQVAKGAAWTRLGATGSGAWSRLGAGRKIISSVIGMAFEVPVFALSSRGLHQLSGVPSPRSMEEDLLGAGITLGLLKSASFAGNTALGSIRSPLARGVIPGTASFLGLLGARRTEVSLGLLPENPGSNEILDTLATMISLGVGSRIGHSLLGTRFAQFQRELKSRQVLDSRRPAIFPDFTRPWAPAEGPRSPAMTDRLTQISRPLLMSPPAGEGGGGKPDWMSAFQTWGLRLFIEESSARDEAAVELIRRAYGEAHQFGKAEIDRMVERLQEISLPPKAFWALGLSLYFISLERPEIFDAGHVAGMAKVSLLSRYLRKTLMTLQIRNPNLRTFIEEAQAKYSLKDLTSERDRALIQEAGQERESEVGIQEDQEVLISLSKLEEKRLAELIRAHSQTSPKAIPPHPDVVSILKEVSLGKNIRVFSFGESHETERGEDRRTVVENYISTLRALTQEGWHQFVRGLNEKPELAQVLEPIFELLVRKVEENPQVTWPIQIIGRLTHVEMGELRKKAFAGLARLYPLASALIAQGLVGLAQEKQYSGELRALAVTTLKEGVRTPEGARALEELLKLSDWAMADLVNRPSDLEFPPANLDEFMRKANEEARPYLEFSRLIYNAILELGMERNPHVLAHPLIRLHRNDFNGEDEILIGGSEEEMIEFDVARAKEEYLKSLRAANQVDNEVSLELMIRVGLTFSPELSQEFMERIEAADPKQQAEVFQRSQNVGGILGAVANLRKNELNLFARLIKAKDLAMLKTMDFFPIVQNLFEYDGGIVGSGLATLKVKNSSKDKWPLSEEDVLPFYNQDSEAFAQIGATLDGVKELVEKSLRAFHYEELQELEQALRQGPVAWEKYSWTSKLDPLILTSDLFPLFSWALEEVIEEMDYGN